MLMHFPLVRDRRSPPGFIQPCQPTLSDTVPTGPEWIHELKHDGYRLLVLKDGDRVRLWSRHGRDWSLNFLAIAAAVRALPYPSIMIGGEAVAHCPKGLPDYYQLMGDDGQAKACLYASDLLHLGRDDLRGLELVERRALLQKSLSKAGPGLVVADHMDGLDGEAMFRNACAMGLEGILSKRAKSRYRSGRCPSWLKIKNPAYQRREAASGT